MNPITHRCQISWVIICAVSERYYFERNLFLQAVGLNSELKIFSNHVVNRCAIIQALLFH